MLNIAGAASSFAVMKFISHTRTPPVWNGWILIFILVTMLNEYNDPVMVLMNKDVYR